MPDNSVFSTRKPAIIQWVAAPIAVASGIAANWLTTHLHVLATFHIDQAGVAGTLTQFGIFGVTAAITYGSHSNWVKGHQVQLKAAYDLYIAQQTIAQQTKPAAPISGGSTPIITNSTTGEPVISITSNPSSATATNWTSGVFKEVKPAKTPDKKPAARKPKPKK